MTHVPPGGSLGDQNRPVNRFKFLPIWENHLIPARRFFHMHPFGSDENMKAICYDISVDGERMEHGVLSSTKETIVNMIYI